jgi:hypothetical protein
MKCDGGASEDRWVVVWYLVVDCGECGEEGWSVLVLELC